MTKILVLGCSFTQGHTMPYENSWSWILSQRHTHLQFLDLSKGGSSIQWAQYCFDNVTDNDYTIAQLTSPHRLSLWPYRWTDISHCLTERSDNYTFWNSNKLELLCDFSSSGWLGTPRFGWPGNSKSKVPFIRKYFETVPGEFHTINYKGVANNLAQQVDFAFKWHNKDCVDYPCIENIIENFEQLQIDEFGHLGVEGSALVADWVEQEFLKPQGLI
jgi:hypothetical protein